MHSYISREFVYRVENKKIINFSFEHFSLFISFNIVKRKLECKNKWKYRIRENFFFFFYISSTVTKSRSNSWQGREKREKERERRGSGLIYVETNLNLLSAAGFDWKRVSVNYQTPPPSPLPPFLPFVHQTWISKLPFIFHVVPLPFFLLFSTRLIPDETFVVHDPLPEEITCTTIYWSSTISLTIRFS